MTWTGRPGGGADCGHGDGDGAGSGAAGGGGAGAAGSDGGDAGDGDAAGTNDVGAADWATVVSVWESPCPLERQKRVDKRTISHCGLLR